MSTITELMKIAVVGSVDDGKSTLIGRMFHDSGNIKLDQLKDLNNANSQRGNEELNLALFTDGLKAEREQGITIDVAYRYFYTDKRKFIIADCPGHFQYTRNMVSGCSTADVVLILVDARNGITEQTRRHTFLASLFNVKNFVLVINKMDLVDYSQEVFESIKDEFTDFVSKFSLNNLSVIPVAALAGDNITKKSERLSWYSGRPLLDYLENIYVGSSENYISARFMVQRVIRPQAKGLEDYRGYSGRIAGGVFKPGDEVQLLPSGFKTKIKKISTYDDPDISEAFPSMSVTILLEENFDLSRGDVIVKLNDIPEVSQDVEALICWFDERSMNPNGKYIIQQGNMTSRCMVKAIDYKININTLHREENNKDIGLNDIGRVKLRTSQQLIFDTYNKNKRTGSFILIDSQTNQTVGAGLIK